MTTRLMIINGPNLNLLGVREPHIYGSTTLASIEASCQAYAQFLGVSLECHQSNMEGELVELIQAARKTADAIIINPAAYSFTSVALFDAYKIVFTPVIEGFPNLLMGCLGTLGLALGGMVLAVALGIGGVMLRDSRSRP